MPLNLTLLLALLIVVPSAAVAADFNAGVAAYERGDYAEALEAFRVLAQEGDPHAQYNLGVQYYRGEGVARDDTVAAHWFHKAAENGITPAQHILGAMYFKGEGVAQDYVQSYALFNVAAQAGDEVARQNRDVMVKLMTPAQLEEARGMSKEFAEKYGNQGAP